MLEIEPIEPDLMYAMCDQIFTTFDQLLRHFDPSLGVSIDFLMTGEASEKPITEVQFPATLARFAAEEGLSFRQTLMMLDMHKQILAHRSAKKKDALDWRKFYESVKEFLDE